MNQKTAKLIRKRASLEGHSYQASKKAWNDIPKPERADVRAQLKDRVESLAPDKSFRARLVNWRFRHGLRQKEAADILLTPFDTYRNWEYGTIPSEPALREIERRMEAHHV